MLDFSRFAEILYSAMGSKETQGIFTQELFYNIVDTQDDNPIDNTTVDYFYRLFKGERSISSLSKKIKDSVEPAKFSAYLTERCSDSAANDLCEMFGAEGIDANAFNFADEIADVFNTIIIEAIKPRKTKTTDDLSRYFASLRSRYNKMKTLLYYNESQPFYDFYIPNDVYSAKNKRQNAEKLFLSGSVNFSVITGTGGIGKSMLMRHLALSLAKNYDKYHMIPILVQLKEYDSKCTTLIECIRKSIRVNGLEAKLENGDFMILLDAMDEIRSAEIRNFEKDLCEFVEMYPKNRYVMSSRPISNFISLNRFDVFKLAPFTKAQALKLINKLIYRPETPELKENFYRELDDTLFETHKDFAENPLLLTIMLMTYERYAKIPYKRHIFYKYAFNTLVEKHDATKVGFDRVFATQMIPEEFSAVLEEFCTRTYIDEKFEFTEDEFMSYFSKLNCLKRIDKKFSCRDLILDLTTNLCILAYDNGKFRFLHRSFQEYFSALKLSKSCDSDFEKITHFFEKQSQKIAADYTFEMMYDLAPAKVERFIFIPFLTKLFDDCNSDDGVLQEYWNFLEIMYPHIYYSVGDVLITYENPPSSYIYEVLLRKKGIERRCIDNLPFREDYVFETYMEITFHNGSCKKIDKSNIDDDFARSIQSAVECGFNLEFDTSILRSENNRLHNAVEESNFAYYLEFCEMKSIFSDMKRKSNVECTSFYDSLFI